ncbi:MAG: PolC-type DNA polymerase III, partial [Gammaproteobacteria bacterium]|nr:PolC-type DNA polymerase III [Gammaproteobacteria bacterium]
IPNINKINYDFVYESYEENDVKDYYKVIMNKLSNESIDFLNAVDFSIKYNPELKDLTVNVPSTFAQIIISKKKIVKLFNQYGFKNINIEFEMVDLDERIETEIEEAKKRHLDGVEVMLSRQKQAQEGVFLNNKKGRLFGTAMDIQYLPTNEEEFNQFKNSGSFENSIIIKGFVELNDEETIEKKSKAKLAISDDTGYCYIERNLRAVEEKRFFKDIQLNQYVEVSGYMYLAKNGDVSFTITNIFVSNYIKPITDRVDDEPVKRVELHLHTKMSQLDGIAYMEDYCKTAQIFGHKAIACTDHGSVQSFHELYEYTKKHPELKPIYGAEFSFFFSDRVKCAYTPKHINLDDATYVVFDFETTGFSVNYERVIEVSAVKIRHGVVIDRFSELVNPEKKIPPQVVALTGITDDDVKDKRTRNEVIRDFYKFCEGCILVAHNAYFDMGHFYENLKNIGIEYEKFPVIDTLYLAKSIYPEHKKYTLDALCRLLGVVLEKHHRALDDATATGEIFLHMLQEVKKLGIEYHDELNKVIKEDELYKYPVKPEHINIICKTQEGLKNLYYITSMANTDFFVRDPIVPQKLLDEYREGLLVGSGCRNGVLFDTAFNKSEEELEKIIEYYDYIELQPISRFEYQKNSLDNWHYQVTDTMKKIVRLAKKHGVPVVATGDCHQINKEDTKYRQILVNYSTKSSAYRHDLKADPKSASYEDFLMGKNIIPDEYYMTTREMLDEFSFLGEKLAYEIVVVNSNLIADSCEFVQSFTDKPFPPKDDFMKKKGIPSAEEYVKTSVYNRAHEMYGELLPGIVKDRIDRELSSIIDNKFSTIYLISQALVKKSEEDGYVVGSRGSVGSSFVAHLMDITEVNSLPPHYRCPKCFFSAFKYTEEEKKVYGIRKDEEPFQKDLNEVLSGYDLPDKNCPCCGTLMIRDGHDIPFETFLGVKEKPKTPDIDLNFSGDNQGQIHNYIRELFGETKAFRAGTILTCKSNVSFAIVRDYYDNINIERQKRGINTIKISKAKIDALAQHIIEVKKSSSQHPGGIVVVPEDHEVYEVTPVQYPGDSTDRSWKTTHFDYHTFEKNFFKLDVLGHDDPTVIRYLMKFVKEHPE